MKLFEKIKDKNRRIIKICGIKILNYKKKVNKIDVFNYIESYKYLLNNIPQVETSAKFQNCVWQYWGQGIENAPELVKKCIQSVQKHCSNRPIIILDDKNIEEYIEIPFYIKEKLEQGIITKTHFSDYLRTCLLAKYGGTWIDATVLLTGEIPEDILESDFFCFQSISFSLCKKCPSKKMVKLLEKIPTYASPNLCLSSWFIHSKSNNILLLTTKKLMEEYWKKENFLIDYFLYHYFVTFAVLNNQDCQEIYNKMPNYNNRNPHLLQHLFCHNFDEEVFNEIKELSSIHKLTYKHKNITDFFSQHTLI